MEKKKVDQLLGSNPHIGFVGAYLVFGWAIYSDAELTIIYSADKVDSCYSHKWSVPSNHQTRPMRDNELMSRLHSGMTPTGVKEVLGLPKCGYENKKGQVTLCYRDAGAEVVFLNGRLLKWKRTHFYDDESTGDSD
jgi:hypothetical protein